MEFRIYQDTEYLNGKKDSILFDKIEAKNIDDAIRQLKNRYKIKVKKIHPRQGKAEFDILQIQYLGDNFRIQRI